NRPRIGNQTTNHVSLVTDASGYRACESAGGWRLRARSALSGAGSPDPAAVWTVPRAGGAADSGPYEDRGDLVHLWLVPRDDLSPAVHHREPRTDHPRARRRIQREHARPRLVQGDPGLSAARAGPADVRECGAA